MPILTLFVTGTIVGLLINTTQNQRRNKHTPEPVQPPLKSESILTIDSEHGMIIMDSLTHIEGISASTAKTLNAAGVLTYGELSKIPPTALITLVSPSTISIDQAKKWVVEAQQLNREIDSRSQIHT